MKGKQLWMEVDGPNKSICPMRWVIMEPHTINNHSDYTVFEIQYNGRTGESYPFNLDTGEPLSYEQLW